MKFIKTFEKFFYGEFDSDAKDSLDMRDMIQNMKDDEEEYEYLLTEAEFMFDEYLNSDNEISKYLQMEISGMESENDVAIRVYNDIVSWYKQVEDEYEYSPEMLKEQLIYLIKKHLSKYVK